MTATLESSALVVEELIPGGSVFVEAAAPHGPAEWRPSWAVLGPASLTQGHALDGLCLDGPAFCPGSVWRAELSRAGRLHNLELERCSRGAGHEGRCR